MVSVTSHLPCTPGHSHPPSKKRRDIREYWLFKAASEVCKECVTHFLTTEHLDPNSVSLNVGYTVLEFALFAQQCGRSEDIVAYLTNTWPQMSFGTSSSFALKGSTKEDCGSTEDDPLLSSKRGQSLLQSESSKRLLHHEEATARLRGLATPLGENIGTRMMRMMGWKEGEPLGACALKDGIQEPLRQDLTRLYKRQRGLGYTSQN